LVTAPDTISSSSTAFDKLGNPIRSVDALANSTQSTFDTKYGNLTTFQNELAKTTSFAYNSSGDLISTILPDGTATVVTPGTQGLTSQAVNARGQVGYYSYDSRGLLTQATYADGITTYTYDGHANLHTATDASGTTTMDYDAADRLTKVTYPDGKFLQYGYDTNGRRAQTVDHNGFTVNYTYDVVGRLAFVRDGNAALIAAYGYDSAGRLSIKNLGNGTYTTYAYDTTGTVKSIVNRAPHPAPGVDGPVNSRFDYTYDVNGNIHTMTTLDGITTYGYDATGQLTLAILPGGRTIQYAYDAAGNRTTVSDTGGTNTSYVANALNQYTSAGSDLLSYDADGNLISRTGPSGTTTYNYDSRNRLIGVSNATDTWSYKYDAFGNRIATTHNGQTTKYLIDPTGLGDVVGEYDGAGNLVARYTQGLGLTSRIDPLGTTAYYDFDALGSTAGLTGASGGNVATYRYLPFGESLSSTGTTANPFQFVGQAGIIHETNGLEFMRARFYSSKEGRFLNRDPIDMIGGTNLYAYVQNSPLRNSDRSGLAGEDDLLPLIGYNGEIVARNAAEAFQILTARARISLFDLQNNPSVPAALATVLAYGKLAGTYIASEIAATTLTGVGTAAGLGLAVGAGVGIVILAGGSAGYSYFFNEGRIPACSALTGNAGLDQVLNSFVACDKTEIITTPNPKLVLQNGEWVFVGSRDPNFISGTQGFGPEHFVPVEATLPYNIEFENKPDATAPAQVVTVTEQLDSDLDWSTFELGAFNFGDYSVSVPAGLQHYSARVDATATLNCFVDVTGNLDRLTGVATWTFITIDPITFAVPTSDPFAGFLPPEDTKGHGQGSVSYTISPKTTLATGTTFNAIAKIIFDTNEPIDTNTYINTIDIGAPTSSVNGLPTFTSSRDFAVSWSGSDETNGSGIASYDIFVSDNSGPYVLFKNDVTSTSTTFTGVKGHTYAFYSIATDNVGHNENPPAFPDATISIVSAFPWSNPKNPLDVDDDGFVGPLDVLVIINRLNLIGPGVLNATTATNPPPYFDCNLDGNVDPLDALVVINFLNLIGNGEGEALSTNSFQAFPIMSEGNAFTPSLRASDKSPFNVNGNPTSHDDLFRLPSSNRNAIWAQWCAPLDKLFPTTFLDETSSPSIQILPRNQLDLDVEFEEVLDVLSNDQTIGIKHSILSALRGNIRTRKVPG